MNAVEKRVDVLVQVGSGYNAYKVAVVAWMERSGNVKVHLAAGKNGTPSQEETALRMLQRDPASVLKQVNKALAAAGYENIDQNAELVDAKVLPGPTVPLHKNDPRLTPDFLATLVVALRTYAKDNEVFDFARDVFNCAGVTVPEDSMVLSFTQAEMDAAEQLDGKAPSPDGVMPQEDVKTVQ